MLLGILLAAAIRHRAMVPPGDPPPQTWLPQHAIALRTAEPTSDDSDLAPILPLVGSARVVALGDATHGTHEFFTLHNRLAKYLIEHADFRTVALEGPYNLEALGRYGQTGEGHPHR